MKAPTIAEQPYSDFQTQVKKLIDYSFKYTGSFDSSDERDFLIDQMGKLIQDRYRHLTIQEVGLAVRWGLDGQMRSGYELNMRSIVKWLSEYSVMRYKYFTYQNTWNSRDTMNFLLNNLDKMPAVKQWYEENQGSKEGRHKQTERINKIAV
jgi:hypothetical protein